MAKATVRPSFVVLVVVVVAVTTARGLDVVKTRQDEVESVVRDGVVAPSFSVEASLVAPDCWVPWPFLSSIFSPFARLYEELSPQSHFLIRHHSPIEVTNFGVVDGLGQISRTDPSLKVSATLKSSGSAEEKNEEEWYVYHLELDYECSEDDPVRRLVVVQLHEQAGDATSVQRLETVSPELTFMFRKQCPLPQRAGEWPVTALFTTWRDGLRGGSLMIAADYEERIEYDFRRPTVMVLVDEAQRQGGYDHARAPVEKQQSHQTQRPAETARLGMLRSFFSGMPLWLSDSLIVIGTTTIIIAAVMLFVDLLAALVRRGDDDGHDVVEDEADGEEVVPLLAHAAELDSPTPAEELQHQLSETDRLAEEALKSNPEALTTSFQDAPKSAQQRPAEES